MKFNTQVFILMYEQKIVVHVVLLGMGPIFGLLDKPIMMFTNILQQEFTQELILMLEYKKFFQWESLGMELIFGL